MCNQTVRKWTALSNIVIRYCLSQTLMSNALQYKASGEFRYIQALTIKVGRGRGGWSQLMGDQEGGQS